MDQLTRRGARYALGLACVELTDYTGPRIGRFARFLVKPLYRKLRLYRKSGIGLHLAVIVEMR